MFDLLGVCEMLLNRVLDPLLKSVNFKSFRQRVDLISYYNQPMMVSFYHSEDLRHYAAFEVRHITDINDDRARINL